MAVALGQIYVCGGRFAAYVVVGLGGGTLPLLLDLVTGDEITVDEAALTGPSPFFQPSGSATTPKFAVGDRVRLNTTGQQFSIFASSGSSPNVGNIYSCYAVDEQGQLNDNFGFCILLETQVEFVAHAAAVA